MRVTPENVLGMYAAVAEEAARLRGALNRFKTSYGDGMPELGNGQPVSAPFARSFNDSTARLVAMCETDVDHLQLVADGLEQAAHAYGRTEQQVKAAFDPATYRYVPAPTQAGPR